MRLLKLKPEIYYFDHMKDFQEEFKIGTRDLVVTNEYLYGDLLEPWVKETNCIFIEAYGTGEPTDEMIDEIQKEASRFSYDRVIALGGGTVIDISKVLILKAVSKCELLFEGKEKPVKEKTLIAVPTTCGTGSEVTNVTIAEMKSRHTKKGLASEENYADYAVLIPETLTHLPYSVFVTSSIDALIHAIESYLSPKASPMTVIFSEKAIRMILTGYEQMRKNGKEARKQYYREFMLASDYAGIAFGNAGCAAVHALSYSIGGAFHVSHGEANYQFFLDVMKLYDEKRPDGKLSSLKAIIRCILGFQEGNEWEQLKRFLTTLIPLRPLSEYGMRPEHIEIFTKSTIENQQRLLANNYVGISEQEIRQIFSRRLNEA